MFFLCGLANNVFTVDKICASGGVSNRDLPFKDLYPGARFFHSCKAARWRPFGLLVHPSPLLLEARVFENCPFRGYHGFLVAHASV